MCSLTGASNHLTGYEEAQEMSTEGVISVLGLNYSKRVNVLVMDTINSLFSYIVELFFVVVVLPAWKKICLSWLNRCIL